LYTDYNLSLSFIFQHCHSLQPMKTANIFCH